MDEGAVEPRARARILFLARSLEAGGAERQLVNLALALGERGFEVAVAVFYGGGLLERELRARVPVHDLRKGGRWDTLGFLARLRSCLHRVRPDIVHGYLVVPNLVALVARVVSPRARVVWGIRASEVDWSEYGRLSSLAFRISCWLSRTPRLLIANSDAGRDYHLAMGHPRGKLIVVHNGIDTERFRPRPELRAEVRRRWGIAGAETVVGIVGRLDPIKDHRTFLESAAILSKRSRDMRFVCVGEGPGPYASALREYGGRLGLEERVSWIAQQDDMAGVYSALDLLASSSRSEGFSNVLAEAMACGVPCVATDVGDARRIVGDSSRVVPPRDAPALADALERLAHRRGEAVPASCRRRVVEGFSIERAADRTARALEQCLLGGAARGRARRRPGDRVKVAHIITDLSTGGAQTMLLKLLERFDRSVFSMEVFSLAEPGPLGRRIEALGVPVRGVGLRGDLLDAWRLVGLARDLARSAPGVVQTWLHHADLFGGLAALAACQAPVLWNVRHSWLDRRRYKSGTILVSRACALLARFLPTGVVSCSEAARDELVRRGYASARVRVVPNGFDTEVFAPDPEARASVRSELKVSEDDLLIGMAGRFDRDKDHEVFVRAAGLVSNRSPRARFLMCGEGVCRENPLLAGWIEASGAKDRFLLLGRREDMARVYAACDIATSSSCTEGFPNVIGEAMACGVPCVATDVGDSALIVGDTGAVVPPRDPARLAAAWLELLEAGERRRRELGFAARQRIRAMYELSGVVAQYERLYLETVTRRCAG